MDDNRACKCYVTTCSKRIATHSNLEKWFKTNLAWVRTVQNYIGNVQSSDKLNDTSSFPLLFSSAQLFRVYLAFFEDPQAFLFFPDRSACVLCRRTPYRRCTVQLRSLDCSSSTPVSLTARSFGCRTLSTHSNALSRQGNNGPR